MIIKEMLLLFGLLTVIGATIHHDSDYSHLFPKKQDQALYHFSPFVKEPAEVFNGTLLSFPQIGKMNDLLRQPAAFEVDGFVLINALQYAFETANARTCRLRNKGFMADLAQKDGYLCSQCFPSPQNGKQELQSFVDLQKINSPKSQSKKKQVCKAEHTLSNLTIGTILILSGLLSITLIKNYRMQRSLKVMASRQSQVLAEQAELRLRHLQEVKYIQDNNHFYEVFWDQMVCQIEDKKCYSHQVFKGRFINQPTYVYVVKLEGIDVSTVEKKLNKLLLCSHSKLSKLFFYCKTDKHLLAFTQIMSPLSQKQLPGFLNVDAAQSQKRRFIIEIIETLDYLQQKIELKWLPLHAIEIQPSRKKEEIKFDFKINSIPCLFRKMPHSCSLEDNDTTSEDTPCFVRHNIASLFHMILLNGESLNPQCPRLLRTNSLQDEYAQFLTFILYEARAVGHTHELLFREVKGHPFLWCQTRKILFLSDFSNFIETYLDEHKVSKMEDYARFYEVVGPNWSKPLHVLFAQEINSHRKYDFQSVKDLIRMIRNKINHFHELPKEVRSVVGKTPQRFMEYCLDKFPKLLYFTYNYSRKKKWRIHMK